MFVDNPDLSSQVLVEPQDFDEDSPIVVVELNHTQAGEILGVSKVKGGNRMATTVLAAMSVVFRPSTQACTLWTTV